MNGFPDPLAVRQALEAFVRACDADEELTQNNADLWDAYEQARQVLLDPVKSWPGGYEDQHYHPYGWKPEDGCDPCDDYREEQAQASEEQKVALVVEELTR